MFQNPRKARRRKSLKSGQSLKRRRERKQRPFLGLRCPPLLLALLRPLRPLPLALPTTQSPLSKVATAAAEVLSSSSKAVKSATQSDVSLQAVKAQRRKSLARQKVALQVPWFLLPLERATVLLLLLLPSARTSSFATNVRLS